VNLKLIIIAFALICCSTSSFGQYNYIQKLGHLATIALPDTPKLQRKEDSEIYLSRYKGVMFMAQVSDIHGGLRDLFSSNNTDNYYNHYIKGLLESTKAKLIYKDKIKINDHDGVEFRTTFELKGQKLYGYQHILCLNDTLLMCGIWSSDSLSKDDKHLKVFFDGFKVRSAKQLSYDEAGELGRKTGKIIAILMLLCIPVLIGLGIVFVIRKLAYRKNKDKSTSA